MTDFIALAGIAASLLKLILRVNDESEAVELIGNAQEAASFLGRLKRGESNIPKPNTDRIEKQLQAKLEGMHDRCIGQGIDINSLEPVATEVVILLEEMTQQKSLLITASRSPEEFPNILQSNAAHRRRNIEERLEPYFDDLVNAVAEEYAQLAPWSPYYQEQAFNAVFDQLDKVVELGETNIELGKKNIEITRHAQHDIEGLINAGHSEIMQAINNGMASHPTTDRIFIGNRPALASNFIHREELNKLQELIFKNTTPRTVLIGMRGSGKSQLASSIAKSCQDNNWQLVAWVDATSRKAIKDGLAKLGIRMGIMPGRASTQEDTINQCLDLLKSHGSSDRVIIFDNVENINDLTNLIPEGDGLRVIATTTNRIGWTQQTWQTINVGMLTQKEASNLLLKHTESQDESSANKIAELLGALPLAIAQAAATASNNNWSLKQYLEQFKKYRSDKMLLRAPGDSYEEETSLAIALAIESTLANLEDNIQIAARYILNCLAILAHTGVPTDWLLLAPNYEHTDTDLNDEPTLQHAALTSLINTSIIQKSEDSTVTKLHRLQAQVWRENWSSEESDQPSESALQLIDVIDSERMFTSDPSKRYTITRDLISQFREITTQPHSHKLFQDSRAQDCLAHILNPTYDLGLHYEQIGLHNTVEIVTAIPTVDTITSIQCKVGLSKAYLRAGYTDTAIDLSEAVCADRALSLKPDESLTLTCNAILAESYKRGGRTERALEIYRDIYRRWRKIAKPYRGETLHALDNLASAYLADGNPDAALHLYDRLIKDAAVLFSSDPQIMLGYKNNRASVYLHSNRMNAAIASFKDIYTEASALLDDTNPDKYLYLYNLAGAHLLSGDTTKAIELFEELVHRATEHLAPKHPYLLDFQLSLVDAYFRGRRDADAIRELRKLIQFAETTFPNSPKVLELHKLLNNVSLE